MNKKYFKWTLIFFAVVIAGFTTIAGCVIVVDPFFQYHKPLKNYPYLIDNQINQNPGMAKHMEYDSVLLGSSMTVNFEADWFQEKMGLNLLKLPYNGAYPKDIANIMACVEESKNPLKYVFLGIDLASYTGGVEETKYPVPAYLYDNNPWNDVEYLLNKEVFLEYVAKPLFSGDGATSLSSVYNSHWWMIEFYGKDKVLQGYNRPERVSEEAEEIAYTEELLANLEKNIRPIIERHPETKFICFYPPYSILFWDEYKQQGQLTAMLETYRVSMEWFLQYDNVELFYFSNIAEIITDLDLYADISHHNQDINLYMTECFVKQKHQITAENYEEELTEMRELAEGFPYEILWQEAGE